MPYKWTEPEAAAGAAELTLWPHQSLPPQGFAVVILGAYLFATIPLAAFVGTSVFWGMLPFLLLAIWGMWTALRRNDKDRQILEVLTVTPERMHLTRHNPRGPQQDWECNTYWASVEMHKDGGPVPHYVTLRGGGREVEIGAFLSEDERKALYSELLSRVRRLSGG